MIYVYLLAAWLVSTGAVGLVAAYKGYEYANNAAEVAALKLDLKRSQIAQKNLQDAVDEANRQDTIAAQSSQVAQEKINALQLEIQRTASSVCNIDDRFLRDLSGIK